MIVQVAAIIVPVLLAGAYIHTYIPGTYIHTGTILYRDRHYRRTVFPGNIHHSFYKYEDMLY